MTVNNLHSAVDEKWDEPTALGQQPIFFLNACLRFYVLTFLQNCSLCNGLLIGPMTTGTAPSTHLSSAGLLDNSVHQPQSAWPMVRYGKNCSLATYGWPQVAHTCSTESRMNKNTILYWCKLNETADSRSSEETLLWKNKIRAIGTDLSR